MATEKSAKTCRLANHMANPSELSASKRSGMVVGMDELEHFKILEGFAVFRPTGQISLERAIEMVTTAITFARAHNIRKLLVDGSNVTGYGPPRIARRYFFIHKWARAAEGLVRVAFVTKAEMIDAQKFGLTVAANEGFSVDVFTTVEEALVWLQSEI